MLRVLSLCSGIGGFELGAELVNQRLGRKVFQLEALCEKNQFCRDRALKPNFPGIPIYEDIRDITANLGDYDLIIGGMPCQPFSLAGKRKGEEDDRNLFPEFFRILRSVRPRGAVIENVRGMLTANSGRFFRDVLWKFTKAGYSVTWHVISCAEVGGVHKRERLWIIAHSDSFRRQSPKARKIQNYSERDLQISRQRWQSKLYATVSSGATAAHSNSDRQQQQLQEADERRKELKLRDRLRQEAETQPRVHSINDGLPPELVRSWLMTPEELPDRLPYATDTEDIPYRKEMLQALGNAIVPDVAAIALYKFLEVSNLLEDL